MIHRIGADRRGRCRTVPPAPGTRDGERPLAVLCFFRFLPCHAALEFVELRGTRFDPEFPGDAEANRIGLSLKRLQDNPWEAAAEKIQEGQVMEGLVSRLSKAGAYIRTDLGLEGLLKHNDDYPTPSPGEQVEVKVAGFNPEHERLDLELTAQPEAEIE